MFGVREGSSGLENVFFELGWSVESFLSGCGSDEVLGVLGTDGMRSRTSQSPSFIRFENTQFV